MLEGTEMVAGCKHFDKRKRSELKKGTPISGDLTEGSYGDYSCKSDLELGN